MRITSPMFAGTNGQTQPKQSTLPQSTNFSGLLHILSEDTVAFSRKPQNPPRFGMDVPTFQNLPENWDALLRRAMREAVNQEGKNANVSQVLYEFEQQYGRLPRYVMSQKVSLLAEKLGTLKKNHLETKNRNGSNPSVEDKTRNIKWTPCEDPSLLAESHATRNSRRREARRGRQETSQPSLPPIAEVWAQAGSERRLSTENNYRQYPPTWGRI